MPFDFDELLAATASESAPRAVKVRGKLLGYVRQLTTAEGLALGAAMKTPEGMPEDKAATERAALSLVAYSCDEEGKQNLTLDQARRLVATAAMASLTRIITAGQRFNELAVDSDEKLEKN